MHFYFYQIFPSKQLIALAIYYKLNLSIQRIRALGKFVIRKFVSIRYSYPTEKFVTRTIFYSIPLVLSVDYASLFLQFRLCS